MDTQSTHFGCFNLQQTSPPRTVFVSDVGPHGHPNRRRKVHMKSRSGCTSCKARKVKCDEEQPCRNCRKRNQICTFKPSRTQTTSTAISRHPAIKPVHASPVLLPEFSTINMAHLRLLHHFDAFTSRTFIMESESWKDAVITLALQNEFLMHAVSLIAATHLQDLQRNNDRVVTLT